MGLYQAVKRVQRPWVANDFTAKRHDLVTMALRLLVPEAQVPTDLGHAVTNMVGCPGLGQKFNEARQGLVQRVNTLGMRASAVADASVLKTLVGHCRDPVDHLGRVHESVVRASKLELA